MKKYVGHPIADGVNKKKVLRDSKPSSDVCSFVDEILTCFDESRISTLVQEQCSRKPMPSEIIAQVCIEIIFIVFFWLELCMTLIF